ncbi:hypothetical protein ACP4OV_020368 [Aristida adscensionis]
MASVLLVLLAALAATASAADEFGEAWNPFLGRLPRPIREPNLAARLSSRCEAALRPTGALTGCRIADAKAQLDAWSDCCEEVIGDGSACACPALRAVLAGTAVADNVAYQLLQDVCGGGGDGGTKVCSGSWVAGKNAGCSPVDGDTVSKCVAPLIRLEDLQKYCLDGLVSLKGEPGGCYAEALAFFQIEEYATVIEKLVLKR